MADMVGIAAKLSRAGVRDYWDDLDRWTRNQFAENQLTEGEWIYRMAESMPKKPVAYNETADQLVKRSLGGFAGYASGNEFALQRRLSALLPWKLHTRSLLPLGKHRGVEGR